MISGVCMHGDKSMCLTCNNKFCSFGYFKKSEYQNKTMYCFSKTKNLTLKFLKFGTECYIYSAKNVDYIFFFIFYHFKCTIRTR